MLTRKQIDDYARIIHGMNKIDEMDLYQVADIFKDLVDDEVGQILPHLPDEDMRKVLSVSFHVSGHNMFTTVFNHIAQYRRPEVLIDLVLDFYWFQPAWRTFPLVGDVFESLDKTLPVILPVIIREYDHIERQSALNGIFRALYRQPNEEALFQKYGPMISQYLREQGLDRDEIYAIYEDALLFSSNKDEILKLLKSSANWWEVMKKTVVGSTAKFVWDVMCRKPRQTSEDIQKLRDWAIEYGISDVATMNGRQLCAQLAQIKPSVDSCDLDDVDPWSQETMRDIPPHRWYKIGNRCFDIESLHNAVKMGERRNPYDRSPLDIDAINTRHARNTMFNVNRLYGLKDIPMMSKQQYLTQSLANIWSVFKYPVPIESFIRASENDLDNVIESMISYSVVPLTTNEIQRYRGAGSRDEKFDVLVHILQRILSLPRDDYTSTINTALELSINENINVRKREREEEDEESEGADNYEPPSQRARTSGGSKKWFIM